MSILNQLSSQVGDRTEESNRAVVAQCLATPALLDEIAGGLTREEAALVGDCAEVLTMVAQERPEWVSPYAGRLVPLLAHPYTRARWEAAHALALVAGLVPETIHGLLPQLGEILRSDKSVIVRDSVVEMLGNAASTSESAAREIAPLLIEALTLWDGRQAGRALNGLAKVAASAPALADELHDLGQPYLDHDKSAVRKAAKTLLKAAAR